MKHKLWSTYLAVATLVMVLALPFLYARLPESARDPKGTLGLGVGILALALIFATGFYSVRRARLWEQWGRLEPWLAIHTYIGIIALLLVFLHADWRFRPGVATTALLLLILVTVSGVIGWAIYLLVPARISSHREEVITPEETFFKMERIQEQVDRLERKKNKQNGHLDTEQEQEHRQLEEKLKVLDKELKAEFRQEAYLGAWLYVHIPLSAALIVVASVHGFMIFYL